MNDEDTQLVKITPPHPEKNHKIEVEEVTYDSKAGKSQVLKWPCFAHSV